MKVGDIVEFSILYAKNGVILSRRVFGKVDSEHGDCISIQYTKEERWFTEVDACKLVTDKHIIHETLLRLSGNEGYWEVEWKSPMTLL